MSKGLEIERKFLVELPDVKRLDVKRRIGITQTYLSRGRNDSQRRVRRIAKMVMLPIPTPKRCSSRPSPERKMNLR